MHTFKQFMERYTSVSKADWEKIEQCLVLRTVEKEEIILSEGKICRHLYFLESGLLHFFISKNGNDITKFFTEAPYLFTSQLSYNQQIAASENIQAIEKSVIWQISKEQADALMSLKSWQIFAQKITQEVQFFTEEILEALQTETAEERYIKMLEQEQDLLQRVPLKNLASYLGIAPQSLSRIRKKIAEKSRT